MADVATTDLAQTPFTWNTLKMIADTELVPKGLRGNPAAMYAAVLMGREIGLGPMQSMNMIDVVDGRPSLSAELQVAMIREAGHSITLEEFSDAVATVVGSRRDGGDSMRVSFTIEMADRAGLTGKRNWKQYPEAMLWARAVSMLARMLFADVFAVVHAYTAEELGSEDSWAEPPQVVDARAPEVEAPAPDESDEELEASLIDALSVDIRGASNMDTIEVALRTMCRVAQKLELVHAPLGASDWLHGQLSHIGAAHVADLTRVELENFTMSIRVDIAERFRKYLDGDNSIAAQPDAGEVVDATP